MAYIVITDHHSCLADIGLSLLQQFTGFTHSQASDIAEDRCAEQLLKAELELVVVKADESGQLKQTGRLSPRA